MLNFRIAQRVAWTVALSALASVGLAGEIPDNKLTPGVWRTDYTVADICKPWFLTPRQGHKATNPRPTLASMKKRACTLYGVAKCDATFEGDHRFPREIGGADSLENMWPEPYAGTRGAHAKDRLENRARKQLCSGAASLKEVRGWFEGDWTKAFDREFGR